MGPEPAVMTSDRQREHATAVDWSSVARAYDWQLPLERSALAAAVDLGRPRREDAWLDLGTGTGGLLRELARRPQRPDLAVGVDDSRAMLARAPELPEGWRLETSDARRLRFADASFSVLSAAYLLHVVDAAARREIVAEAHRVLVSSGRLVVVTPALPRARLARALYAALARAAGPLHGAQNPLGPLDPREDLRDAGFTIEAARHVGGGYPSLCVFARRRG